MGKGAWRDAVLCVECGEEGEVGEDAWRDAGVLCAEWEGG